MGSGPHSREAYQVIEEETGSHEVVGTYFTADLAGPSSFVRNLERATMASQVPLRRGLGGQGRGLGGPPQGAPGGGVGGQGGQQPGLHNPAPFMVMEDLPIVVPVNLPIMPTYPHFQTFEGLTHQDPQKHVRDLQTPAFLTRFRTTSIC